MSAAKMTAPPAADVAEPVEERIADATHLGGARKTLMEGAITGVAGADAALAEEIVWAWEGFFTDRSHVEIAGKSTSGKTTFACAIVAAMAAPPDHPVLLFGRKVSPMPEGQMALVVFEENSRRSATEKIDIAIAALGIPRAYAWSRILLRARWGLRASLIVGDAIRNPEIGDRWAAVMHAAIVQKAFGLVVFDTRARIFGALGPSNDEDAQALAGMMITQIAEVSRAPVLVLSHLRKGGGEDLEDIAGSAQRGATADAVIIVTGRKQGGQTMSSKVTLARSRDTVDDWPAPFEFVLGKEKAGGPRLTFTCDGSSSGGEPAHEKVAVALASQGPMTARQVREAVGLSGKAANDALRVLVAEKRASKVTRKVKGVQREVYEHVMSWNEIADSKSGGGSE